jgi:hypothetical protein
VSIPAAMECVPFIAALIAAFQMAAERRRTTHFNCGHDTPLRTGHRRAMPLSIRFS